MAQLPTAESIRDWLVAQLSSRLGVDPSALDMRERFSRYGLKSAEATRLLADLSRMLDRPLSPTLVWDHPTIEALARHLAGEGAAPSARQADTVSPADDEPIAVVGMACRFPDADSPEAFWRLLRDGVDAVREVPAERWDVNALYDVDPSTPGKMSTRWGGFLERVDGFDPQFFGISPREAERMDPQQRLALELAWEALEDAGIPPPSLQGSRTGVFFGAIWNDYATLDRRRGASAITEHSATGSHYSLIANRISYQLGLRGPSLVVDTACSASLVAVHLACQALRSGEATLALVGGVNLIVAPDSTVAMSKFGAMAPDGRSKAFDARADGYVRGEGGGTVVLKPLSHALADGDPVWCVIRGSAVNNDGASNGLTAPNPQAQVEVLEEAYRRAGVDPARVHYVEAHGTGTMLGDPIEAGALGTVLGTGRDPAYPLLVGSVKTNIGHLEAAAGIAGLIKTALAIRHRTLPPSLHFERPNPHIPFDALRLRVNRALSPWPGEGEPALAGVSSFGFGGTNAHVVLEEAPRSAARLALFAAADVGSLRERLRAVASALEEGATLDQATRQAGEEGPVRLARVVRSSEELATALGKALEGEEPASVLRQTGRNRVAFVFSGTGGQWAGMAGDLLREPAFRTTLAQCDREIRRHAGWSVLQVLAAGSGDPRLERIDVVQPTLWALQVSLAALLEAWGVHPDMVLGHSMGEIAAASVSGALSLEDAARLICVRSALVSRTSGQGAMAVVELGDAAARAALADVEGRVSVAACNGPRTSILSGEPEALREVLERLEAEGVFVRRVKVDYASHGPQMDPLLPELVEELRALRPRSGTVPLASTVEADLLPGAEMGPEYWARNLREPVLLAPTVVRLLEQGVDTFLELGPHPILADAMRETAAATGHAAAVLPAMRRGEEGRAVLLEALAALFERGARPGARWPLASPGPAEEDDPAPCVVPVSAHTLGALRERARALRELGASTPGLRVSDLAYTAGVHRAHHEHRFAAVAPTLESLVDSLDAFLAGEERPGLAAGRQVPGAKRKLVFVFPGQGGQWAGMGRRLLSGEPVFRDAVERCEAAFRPYVEWSLTERLLSGDPLEEIDVVQPALFAVQVALAALWRSWGVEPDAVVGHSMGEIAAAHVAGALSLEEAARVICLRSRLLRQVAGQGAMAVVELSLDEARAAVAGIEDQISVAVSNSPRSTVLSGDPEALDALLERLVEGEVFCRRVQVDVASHSPQVEPLLEALAAGLADLSPAACAVPMHSTVTGEEVEGGELGAAYWARNLREPVLFASVVERLARTGHEVFLEVGPHPVLLQPLAEVLRAAGCAGRGVASLRRDEDERSGLLAGLAGLYAAGRDVEWARLFPRGGARVPLPAYPWQRERFWLEDVVVAPFAVEGAHPLLGACVELSEPAGARVWSVDPGRAPWLRDHRVRGAAVFPAAATAELALASAREVLGAGALRLEGLELVRLLPLADEAGVQVQLSAEAREADAVALRLSSRPAAGGEWTLHATARVRRASAEPAELEIEGVRARCGEEVSAGEHQRAMRSAGLEYGPAFQGVCRLWLGEDEALAELALPEPAGTAESFAVHPALLDAAFQVAEAVAIDRAPAPAVFLPVAVEGLRVAEPVPGELRAHARLRGATAGVDGFRGDVVLADGEGRVVAEVRGLRLARSEGAGAPAGRTLEVRWREAAPAVAGGAAGGRAWLILADAGGVGAALRKRLEGAGDVVVSVEAGAAGHDHSALPLAADPADEESVACALERARASVGRPLAGVVHLWALDAPGADAPVGVVVGAQERACRSTLAVVRSLTREGDASPRLWLVTAGAQAAVPGDDASPAQAALWGLGRTVALEHPGLRCTRIDLGPEPERIEVEALAAELETDGMEDEVALRGRTRLVPRLERVGGWEGYAGDALPPFAAAAGQPFRLEVLEPGASDGVGARAVGRSRPAPGEVEIEVEAAGLNFRDVMKALGIYPGLPPGVAPLGDECAGRVSAVGEGVEGIRVGDPVVAVARRALATHALADARLVAPCPTGVPMVEAAAVPIAFLTAAWSLLQVARLETGERVLIHAAAGGVGMAAVQLARRAGAEVFATAGSAEKRELLRALGIRHVFDSRSTGFAAGVVEATGGEGVDVVLNSLAGEFISAGLSVLRPGGRFVEIGKRDLYGGGRLEMAPLRDNVTFAAVDLELAWRTHPERVGRLLREITAAIEAGDLSPLPTRAFPSAAAGEAFRWMAEARHTGKVVVDFTPRAAAPVRVSGGLRADGTYLVTGGLGGLGLAVARWMAERGAGTLVLLSRRGPTPGRREAVAGLEALGARVLTPAADVGDPDALAAVLERVRRELPPLRGVVHAAGVLDDATLDRLTWESFRRVAAPKADGAWNLHRLTRDDPLDLFVLFSSVTALLGTPGQGNYAAANAFLDALAHHRRARGLPALSINWGPWTEIGLAAARADRGARLARRGVGGITPAEGVAAFAELAVSGAVQAAVVPLDAERWCRAYPAAAATSLLRGMRSEGDEVEAPRKSTLREELLAAEAGPRRRTLLEAHVREQVARVLRLSPARVEPDRPLRALGLDSLMAIELRNRLEASLAVTVPATAIWNYPNVGALVPFLAKRMEVPLDGPPRSAPPVTVPVGALAPVTADDKAAAALEALSDEEAEAMLLDELDSLDLVGG